MKTKQLKYEEKLEFITIHVIKNKIIKSFETNKQLLPS